MSEWKKLKVGGRQWNRLISRAIRGSWIRALAELVTNGDDSYGRLERLGQATSGRLVVELERSRDSATFRVIDEAEGMTAARLEQVFGEYGGEIAAGQGSRGFFNRGAKDALLAMRDGREETICDGEYSTVDLRAQPGREPERRIIGPKRATRSIRNRLGLEANGTVASFSLPGDFMHVPQYETVRSALAQFWMLRKIVDPANTTRALILRYRGREEEVVYPLPVGATLIDGDEFVLKVSGYPDFRYRLTLKRADQDLDQTASSDQRVGGLLLVDEGDAVLDLTLGRFDREPAAAPFFGEVKILAGFKDFLRAEEKAGRSVLSEERNGLELAHPWVQQLLRSIEDKIESHVEKEKSARAQAQQELTDAERSHQQRVMQELNRILEDETKKSWKGNEETDRETLPPAGLEIVPGDITIAEGTPRYIAVRCDPQRCPPGSVVYLEDESGSISLEPQEFNVEDDGEAVFVRSVRVTGGVAGQSGKITGISADLPPVEAQYHVVPDTYPDFDSEMAFVPQESQVVDQKVSVLSLYFRTSAVAPGQIVRIASSNESHLSVLTSDASLDPRDVKGEVGKIRIRIRAAGVGQRAIISASVGDTVATANVTVRSQRVTPPERGGLFRGIEFSREANPSERMHFDENSGKIIIHLSEPTVTLHLGAVGEYRELLNSKTLVAELVAQCFAQQVARRKIVTGARVYFDQSAAGQFQEDQAEIRALVYKYGAAIHKLVVEPSALREARTVQT